MVSILDLGMGYGQTQIIEYALSQIVSQELIAYNPDDNKHPSPAKKIMNSVFSVQLDIAIRSYHWSFIDPITRYQCGKYQKNQYNGPNIDKYSSDTVQIQKYCEQNIYSSNKEKIVIKFTEDVLRLLPSYFVDYFAHRLIDTTATALRPDLSFKNQIAVALRQKKSEAILIDKQDAHRYYNL